MNSNLGDSCLVLEKLVRWSHLAPTCPDTLGCFPYQDKDPFVLEHTPHVLFAGNQEKFGCRDVKIDGKKDRTVTLISIPVFSESKSVVSLNLRTMEAEEIKFEAQFVI